VKLAEKSAGPEALLVEVGVQVLALCTVESLVLDAEVILQYVRDRIHVGYSGLLVGCESTLDAGSLHFVDGIAL
jgi:hypothetical protein